MKKPQLFKYLAHHNRAKRQLTNLDFSKYRVYRCEQKDRRFTPLIKILYNLNYYKCTNEQIDYLVRNSNLSARGNLGYNSLFLIHL